MVQKLLITLILILLSSNLALANTAKKIILAVGHDHVKMLDSNYPIYRANWEFISESLELLGYRVTEEIMPWARAKRSTQDGKAHGLFLAANLPGRDEWAELSDPLGYGVFGGFYHVDNKPNPHVIAAVRLGSNDKILTQYDSTDLLEVATAQSGFKLLFNKKVDRFIMSESYGEYLLNNELRHFRHNIKFDVDLIEQRTVHIAFSKKHQASLDALQVVNQAIKLGLNKGLYEAAMKRNEVPKRMQLERHK